MKRTRTGHDLVFDLPLPAVGEKGAVFMGQAFARFLESGLEKFRRKSGIHMVFRDFEQAPLEEPALEGRGHTARQRPWSGRGAQNAQSRLRSRQGDGDIQRMLLRPGQECLGAVPPAQAKGWRQWGLCEGGATTEEGQHKKSQHVESVPFPVRRRKNTSARRGMVLLEATIALSIITVLGLVLLKMSMNILHPRQWILQQTLSDAYMTYERAFAERVPFEQLIASSSEWPAFPSTSTTQVELGRTPGGNPVYGTVVRTRMPDENVLPAQITTGMETSDGAPDQNPSAMKVWRVQSVLTYEVGGRAYAKSRTVIRNQ